MGALVPQKRVMIRRRTEEEHVNHERWVISYADFITLLFAFFVVMYSISSVNDGKYRVLSDSLEEAFQSASKTLNPTPIGEKLATSGNYATPIPLPMPGDFPSKEDYKYSVEGLFDDVKPGAARQGEHQDNQTTALTKLSEKMASRLQTEISSGDVKVVNRGEWLELSIQSSILFGSGQANLSTAAKTLLQKTANILKDGENPIQVEGFTDNIPIETEQFPSNWELSGARAAAVVRWFISQGVAANRLAAVGYGDQRPLVANDTDAGRSQNRRISIIVSNPKPPTEDTQATSNGPDYKLGGGSVEGGVTGESSADGNPVEPMKSTETAPLKIMTLEDGRLLFSADPGKRAASGNTTRSTQ